MAFPATHCAGWVSRLPLALCDMRSLAIVHSDFSCIHLQAADFA